MIRCFVKSISWPREQVTQIRNKIKNSLTRVKYNVEYNMHVIQVMSMCVVCLCRCPNIEV